MPPSVGN
jgi:hypothetical protein